MARPLPHLLLSPFLLIIFLFAASCAAQGEGPRFQCSGATSCAALAGYVPTNDTNYGAIRDLFNVEPISSLFGANNVTPSTPASARVPAGTLVRVPFPCTCANGTGVSDRRPIYTVVKDDTLFNIASQIFRAFVVFPQIVARNNIQNESLIEIGQRLWIPLPCSCDPVDGAKVEHLAYIVPTGSNMSYIADQFGTTPETLARINNISDPQSLTAGQVLDVPLGVLGGGEATTPATGTPDSEAPATWTWRQQLLAPLGAALLLSAVL